MTAQQSRQIRSTITAEGKLQLNLETTSVPAPKANEVLIRVQATPINPSDLGLLIGPADVGSIQITGSADDPVVTMDVPKAMLPALSARLDESMPVGNEGAGEVVAAGSGAEHLIGKIVGIAGGAMYSEYVVKPAAACLVMNKGTTAEQAASCFVNPLTSLSMVETMRKEGHTGLVHTAAASNLGQMLVKICKADNVPLVTIVRKPEQVKILQDLGAEHVCNSSDDDFMDQLVKALSATGATLAFDAIGGGELGSQILAGMETAANLNAAEYSRYGSSVHKQVYIYGGLDRSPTVLKRSYGMVWSIGGWLLTPFLQGLGQEKVQQLRQRVVDEIDTTFASHYDKHLTLAEVLSEDAIKAYSRQATGEKYLITP